MVLALPNVDNSMPARCVAHVTSMGADIEMLDFTARRSVTVMTHLQAFFYFTILGDPDCAMHLQTLPLMADLAVVIWWSTMQCTCPNKTRRAQRARTPLTTF